MTELFIVESPTKCPKIRKILQAYEPGQWRVIATAGHWRGLPDMAGQDFAEVVDPERDFAEGFVVHPAKKNIERELRESIRTASEVFIATDDDREGEAIGWHIVDYFRLKGARRVRCREITTKGVVSGIQNAGSMDLPLVEAQRARSVVDYRIGMEVSRLIWRFDCKSAGRLQSCALRILVAREKARQAFVSQDFWTLHVDYAVGLSATVGIFEAPSNEDIDADEKLVGGEPRLVPKRFDDRAEAERYLREAESARHVVEFVERKPTKRNPPPPFTTSDLLGTAASRLGFATEKTGSLAQKLFEAGVITYIRTDSTALSDDAIVDIRSYLGAHHGELLPDEPVRVRQAAGAQAAHEAIRPTKMTKAPDAKLSVDESALYDLIFLRTLCSQARSASIDRTTMAIEPAGCSWRLLAHGSVARERGWIELDPEISLTDNELPPVEVGQTLPLEKAELKARKTKSPPRFNERSLIRYLERRGVGRPSTYVEMLKKLRERGYIAGQGKELVPQELGFLADELVTLGFEQLTREDFTANTEKALDAIAGGEIQRVQFLDAFFRKFQCLHAEAAAAFAAFAAKNPGLDREAIVEHGTPCPKCGAVMHQRKGKSGRYAKCSGEGCGQVVSLEAPKLSKDPCPSCGARVRQQPYTKYGKRKTLFVCQGECGWKSGFAPPKCAKESCPKCGGRMVARRSGKRDFLGCVKYPLCDGARPVPQSRKPQRAK